MGCASPSPLTYMACRVATIRAEANVIVTIPGEHRAQKVDVYRRPTQRQGRGPDRSWSPSAKRTAASREGPTGTTDTAGARCLAVARSSLDYAVVRLEARRVSEPIDKHEGVTSAYRFSLDGVEVTVFVHGEDPAVRGLALTPAQREVVDLLEAGHSNKLIAARLGLGEAAVRKRLESAYRRLGVHSRAELVLLLQDRRRSR